MTTRAPTVPFTTLCDGATNDHVETVREHRTAVPPDDAQRWRIIHTSGTTDEIPRSHSQQTNQRLEVCVCVCVQTGNHFVSFVRCEAVEEALECPSPAACCGAGLYLVSNGPSVVPLGPEVFWHDSRMPWCLPVVVPVSHAALDHGVAWSLPGPRCRFEQWFENLQSKH